MTARGAGVIATRDRRMTHASIVAEPPSRPFRRGQLRHLTNAVPAFSQAPLP